MGRRTSWQSLRRLALLAVSILSSCFLLAEGQLITIQVQIQLQPPHPVKGQNLTLTPTPRSDVEKAFTCRWFRGLTTDDQQQIFIYYLSQNISQPGQAFSGRETVGPGCSLHIRNVTPGDTGNFTVALDGPAINAVKVHASVVVSVVLLKPTVSVFPSTFPIEFSTSVQLTCTTNSRYANVSWLWNGGPLRNSSRIQLSDNDWVLDIKDINRNDAGMYQCQVSNSVSDNISDITHIDVIYGPDTLVIQPDKQSYVVHSDIQLNCAASSVPKAHYSWFFNEKNVINESVLLIQNVTHEHSGNYTCQALNELTRRTASTPLEIEVVGDVYDVVIITGQSAAIENAAVSLNCTSVGENVSYSWLKGDELVVPEGNVFLADDNKTLTFDPCTRDDTANYTCFAFNNFSSASSDPYWLEVFYGPDRPIISPPETLYSLGSNVTLSCFANSNPPANYLWYYNGQQLEQQNTSQHLILNLSWTDEGNYVCNASNEVTGLFNYSSQPISLMKPVTQVTISGPDKAIENDTTVLNCNSDGTKVFYHWLEGNQSLGGHIFLSNDNKTLTFNPTLRDDSGNYTCYGNNGVSEANATYSLNVLYGPDVPQIDPGNATQYYPEGGILSLSCEADSNPHAQYSWLINGSEVAKNQSQLLLNYLSFNDSGNYTCNASNSETGRSNFTIVEIYVQENLTSPVLSTSAHDLVEENSTVTLSCITSNSADVGVTWFKDDKSLPDGAGLSERNRTLTLTRVTKSDTGLYRCNASNFVSSAKSNSVQITVAYGPVIQLNPEGPIEKSLNSDLKLECIADSVPPARFQWFFNNSKRDASSSSILQVRLSNWADEGNYACQATNPFTNHSATKTVSVNLTEENSGGSDGSLSPGAIAGIVIGSLAAVALIAGLLYFICTKTSLGRTEQHASNGNVPSAPGHNQGVTDTKPKSAEEDLQYSILAFKDSNRSPPRPKSEAPPSSDGATIYSEIKKK